ncbi:hypothetical protein F511_34646 [Dorcoceras hygrometricum]|uniref:GIR1-like zinc ribbon domain-containing protein n=1 Tax=Dorcoceras hygrometricum TaxID=472368 RepID=A0A2Z7A1F8_9LAMI|nr:hypothetical protein F511_34646 [Dorcoceras hygrometricum]
MNPRNAPQLDLKLNLSPPRMIGDIHESPSRSSSTSPQSSCVSSEPNQPYYCSIRQSTSPEATTSMVLVGCPRCLMYVMLAEDDPRCPKCKSTGLLDVLHDNYTRKSTKKKS